jgi:hypothetical protein
MFLRSFRATTSLPLQTRYLLRSKNTLIRPFTSFTSQTAKSTPPVDEKAKEVAMVEFLSKHDIYVNDYMKKLSKYLIAASALGIGSAHLLSMAVPLGFPSAFMLLAGFGLEQTGSHYINRTGPQYYTYKDAEGKIHYSSHNTWKRKMAFVSTCLGYGCIISSMLSIIPVTTSVLPLSAVGCLFSTLGHYTYSKFAPKPYFNTKHLFVSGLLTGIVGLNLVTSGSAIFLLENALHLENVEFSTYLGLILYNVFTGHDSEKALEDVQSAKGDFLKHATKFAENWLYALVPHFLMNMY